MDGLRRSWTGTSRNFNKNGQLFIEKIIDYQEHSKLKIANADMDYKYLATAIEISRHGGGNYWYSEQKQNLSLPFVTTDSGCPYRN